MILHCMSQHRDRQSVVRVSRSRSFAWVQCCSGTLADENSATEMSVGVHAVQGQTAVLNLAMHVVRARGGVAKAAGVRVLRNYNLQAGDLGRQRNVFLRVHARPEDARSSSQHNDSSRHHRAETAGRPRPFHGPFPRTDIASIAESFPDRTATRAAIIITIP